MVPWSKKVEHTHAASGQVPQHGVFHQLQHAVAVGRGVGTGDVKGPVARRQVDGPEAVRREACAAHPDSTRSAVRRGVEHGDLRQGLSVIADEPAVIGAVVAMRSPRDIDDTVHQEEAGPIQLPQRVEDDLGAPAPVAYPDDGGAADGGVIPVDGVTDHDGSAHPLGPRPDVEGVKPLDVVRAAGRHLFGLRHDIQRPGDDVDDGRPGDADFWRNVLALDVLGRDRGDAIRRVNEADLPEQVGTAVVGVEGVHAIVLGRDEYHVMKRPTRNVDVRDVQRLRVDGAVDGG